MPIGTNKSRRSGPRGSTLKPIQDRLSSGFARINAGENDYQRYFEASNLTSGLRKATGLSLPNELVVAGATGDPSHLGLLDRDLRAASAAGRHDIARGINTRVEDAFTFSRSYPGALSGAARQPAAPIMLADASGVSDYGGATSMIDIPRPLYGAAVQPKQEPNGISGPFRRDSSSFPFGSAWRPVQESPRQPSATELRIEQTRSSEPGFGSVALIREKDHQAIYHRGEPVATRSPSRGWEDSQGIPLGITDPRGYMDTLRQQDEANLNRQKAGWHGYIQPVQQDGWVDSAQDRSLYTTRDRFHTQENVPATEELLERIERTRHGLGIDAVFPTREKGHLDAPVIYHRGELRARQNADGVWVDRQGNPFDERNQHDLIMSFIREDPSVTTDDLLTLTSLGAGVASLMVPLGWPVHVARGIGWAADIASAYRSRDGSQVIPSSLGMIPNFKVQVAGLGASGVNAARQLSREPDLGLSRWQSQEEDE